MGNRKSTCLYIDKEILEAAKRMGLNISKVSENALVEAVRGLKDPKPETAFDSPARSGVWGRGRDLTRGAF